MGTEPGWMGPDPSSWFRVAGGLILAVAWILAVPRYCAVLSRPNPAGSGEASHPLAERRPGELAVAFLDVGYGRAILLQGPGDVTSLIGGGIGQYPRESGLPVEDAAHQVLLPWFRGAGVRRLHRMIGTVPADHHLGAEYDLLGHASPVVERVLLPPAVSPAVGALRRRARRRRITVDTVPPDESFELVPGVPARVLNRPPVVRVGSPLGQALFFRYGRQGFLLGGDLDRPAQRQIVLRWGDSLRAAVLEVAGHGREEGTHPLLLRYVRPRYAVVPTGRPNPVDAPSPRVMRLLRRRVEDKVYRTDRDGTVVFYTDGRHLRVRTDPRGDT